MKEIKVEWCENFIKHYFEKLEKYECTGIETEYFWREAETPDYTNQVNMADR